MSIKQEREEKLRAVTREAIRTAVLGVIAEYGQEGITMQRVADEAGLAKGTLYLYFENKEQLLNHTIDWCYKSLVEGLEEIFDADMAPDEKMDRLFDFHHQYFHEHQEIFRMLMMDRNVNFANRKEEKDKNANYFLQKTTDIIQEGIDKGIFKDMNATTVAHIMIESSRGLILYFLRHDEKCSFDSDYKEAAGILKEILGKGLFAE
jgi:AcrR family transcriptional regulator